MKIIFVFILTGMSVFAADTNDYRAIAREAYAHGNYSGAISNYTKLLRLKPGDQEASTMRGVARAHTGDLDGGIADCTSAIRLRPSGPAYLARGAILHMKGDENGAMADFTQAILLKPDDAGAWFNRGVSLKCVGRYGEAITNFTESIRLVKDERDALHAYQQRAALRDLIGDHVGAVGDSNIVSRSNT